MEQSQIAAEKSLDKYFLISRDLRKKRSLLNNELETYRKNLSNKTAEMQKYNWYEKHLKTITYTTLIIAIFILFAPLINRLFWYFGPGKWVESKPPLQLEKNGHHSEVSINTDTSKQIKLELAVQEKAFALNKIATIVLMSNSVEETAFYGIERLGLYHILQKWCI